MSFQESADTLTSRLHLNDKPVSAVVGVIVVAMLVIACAVFGVVRANHASDVEVVSAQDAAVVSGGSLSQDDENAVSTAQVFVHVSGCVANPGVVCLDEGSRVAAAIEAAGGATPEAALDSVNLARVVFDGEQIIVPSHASVETAQGASAGASVTDSATSSERININTADVALLQTLNGIGESTAQKIVKDREANGPFKTIEDIKRVSGIGDKKFEGLKDFICV